MQERLRANGPLLRSAECARRTGLTVRALRLYERVGLVRPNRDRHGWRLYGQEDLARLNTVVVLKYLGLSLRQIRTALPAGATSLRDTLERQKKVWTAQKKQADQGLKAVRGALAYLERRGSLSTELLCELVSQFEMPGPEPEIRALTARHMTPREVQRWSDWWADHPQDLVEKSRYLEAQRDVLIQLKSHMSAGNTPADPRVSRLISKWENLLLVHNVRERACRQLDWNCRLATKWYRLGQRDALDEAKPQTEREGLYSPEFADFLEAAYWQSAIGKALDEVLASARELAAARIVVTSLRARALGRRFRAVCQDQQLGDPLTHARFAEFIESLNPASATKSHRRLSWKYLYRALSSTPARSVKEA